METLWFLQNALFARLLSQDLARRDWRHVTSVNMISSHRSLLTPPFPFSPSCSLPSSFGGWSLSRSAPLVLFSSPDCPPRASVCVCVCEREKERERSLLAHRQNLSHRCISLVHTQLPRARTCFCKYSAIYCSPSAWDIWRESFAIAISAATNLRGNRVGACGAFPIFAPSEMQTLYYTKRFVYFTRKCTMGKSSRL